MCLVIYFIGCILSFGRMNGCISEIIEDKNIFGISVSIILGLLSWAGFIGGCIIYLCSKAVTPYSDEKFLDFKLK